MPRIDLIQYRRGSAAEWDSVNPVLESGEIGFAIDANEVRVGDGVSPWMDLDPIGGSVPEGEIADAVAAYMAENPAPPASDDDIAGLVLDPLSDTHSAVLSLAGGGTPGDKGDPGDSAYQIAVENGFVGTEGEWLESLHGEDGASGSDGSDGASAYEVAVNDGFEGDEAAWLASLQGEQGDPGAAATITGATASTLPAGSQATVTAGGVPSARSFAFGIPAGAPGSDGTDGTDGNDGLDGASAYELAVEGGFVGTEEEWLDSLHGEGGAPGTTSFNGLTDVPATFPPSAHTQAISTITGLQDALDTTVQSVVAGANISINNADPRNPIISSSGGGGGDVGDWGSIGGDIGDQTDLMAELAAKQDAIDDSDDITEGATNLFLAEAERTKLAGIESGAEVNSVESVAGRTGAVVLAKADVALGNVDNTADLAKPVSVATQAALDAKADSTDIPTTPGDIGAATAAQGSLANTAVQPEDLGTAASADVEDFRAGDWRPGVEDIEAANSPNENLYLRGDGRWSLPTNTTYSLLAAQLVENPTSGVSGLISGQRLAQSFAANLANTGLEAEVDGKADRSEILIDGITTEALLTTMPPGIYIVEP